MYRISHYFNWLASHIHWAEIGCHLPENPSLCQAAGIECSFLQFCSAGRPFLLATAILNQGSPVLWTQMNILGCTYTSTLLYDFEINKTKGAKQGRCLSDAALGSVYLLTQTASHKITVVYCLWKDPLPHSALFIWRFLECHSQKPQ